ncbi:hypothetical protein MRX96_037367 [Rhipicephalus microplus]
MVATARFRKPQVIAATWYLLSRSTVPTRRFRLPAPRECEEELVRLNGQAGEIFSVSGTHSRSVRVQSARTRVDLAGPRRSRTCIGQQRSGGRGPSAAGPSSTCHRFAKKGVRRAAPFCPAAR